MTVSTIIDPTSAALRDDSQAAMLSGFHQRRRDAVSEPSPPTVPIAVVTQYKRGAPYQVLRRALSSATYGELVASFPKCHDAVAYARTLNAAATRKAAAHAAETTAVPA